MKITHTKYAKALADTLEKTAHPKDAIRQFLSVLNRRKAMKILQKIIEAFEAEWAKRKGISRIFIHVPKKFQKDAETFIRDFEKKSGKNLDTTIRQDDSIIGGMVIRADDLLIDASVKNQLDQLKDSFTSTL